MVLTIDSIVNVLSYFPFSLPASTFLTLVYYCQSRLPYTPIGQFLSTLPTSLKSLIIFTLIRSISSSLSHSTLNNFYLKSDKPNWNSSGDKKKDIVLITGGITGIGLEVVKLLRFQGATIVVLDLIEVGKDDGINGVHYYKCDVTDRESIKEIGVRTRKEVGEPTILINNAGIARGKTILTTSPEEFLLTYKVNVLGCHNILNEFLPYLISINHGHVMTVASSASYMSIPQLSEYSCSKAAVLALHEVLKGELVHRYNAPKIRTSIICPTKVATQMGNGYLSPTLTAPDLASKMVLIINSGYSAHLIAPHFAAALLPLVRVMPDCFRYGLHAAGKTHETITDEGNKKQSIHYTVVNELDKKHGLTIA